MAFRLNRKEDVGRSIRRIATEQIDGALDELRTKNLPDATKVHQTRKHCKKLRALVRLVHSAFEDHYHTEDRYFRDVARPLSVTRDAQTVVKTWNLFLQRHCLRISQKAFTSIERELNECRTRPSGDDAALSHLLKASRRSLRRSADRVADWTLDTEGFAAIRGGLERTYRCARQAMKYAAKSPSDEAFHDWRKHVKYHWYHCRLLRGLWPPIMNARRQEVHQLAEALGNDHDLTVLSTTIQQLENKHLSQYQRNIIEMIERDQVGIESHCTILGRHLFAEPTHTFSRRLGLHWNIWKSPSRHLAGQRS